MSAIGKMGACFMAGRRQAGWCCWTCHAEHPHNGTPIRAFARLTKHALLAHHRLPSSASVPGCFMHGDFVWHRASPVTFTTSITWNKP